MAKAEVNPIRAHQRILDAASTEEAAQYLCNDVGIDTVRVLADKAGIAYGSDTTMMQWCKRLATRLQLIAYMERR